MSPIFALFCDKDGWLPKWLGWFQPPDNSCDGDRGHKARWPKQGKIWNWMRRTAWLFRNSAYGFNLKLGFKYKEGDVRMTIGNPEAGDRSGVSGIVHHSVYRNNKLVAFQHYYVKHYRIFGIWRCVRAGFGYKNWTYFNPIKGSGRNND